MIYNGYLTTDERECAASIAEFDFKMKKLDTLYEAVEKDYQANLIGIEAKVLAESGTYDDLEILYTEAENEAGEKKKGILKRIIDAIVTFAKKIQDFFASKFIKKVDEPVEVPEETLDAAEETIRYWDDLGGHVDDARNLNESKLTTAADTIKNFIEKHEKVLKGLAIGVGAAAGSTAAAVGTHKIMKKVAPDKVNNYRKRLDDIANKTSKFDIWLSPLIDYFGQKHVEVVVNRASKINQDDYDTDEKLSKAFDKAIDSSSFFSIAMSILKGVQTVLKYSRAVATDLFRCIVNTVKGNKNKGAGNNNSTNKTEETPASGGSAEGTTEESYGSIFGLGLDDFMSLEFGSSNNYNKKSRWDFLEDL